MFEEEQRDFRGFLSRLRTAKDKAEFDQFEGPTSHPPGAEYVVVKQPLIWIKVSGSEDRISFTFFQRGSDP